MPTSTWVHITDMATIIVKLQPKRVLDVGCGFGRWGFLCRELLDIGKRRWSRDTWEVFLAGVEPTEEYITDVHREVYSLLIMNTVQFALDSSLNMIDPFDLIIAGDVMEHMPKKEAEAVMEGLEQHCKGAIIYGLPIGLWPQEAINGNEYERHVDSWTVPEFSRHVDLIKLYPSHHKVYAVGIRYPQDRFEYVPKGFTRTAK